jgi:hypothetical protein
MMTRMSDTDRRSRITLIALIGGVVLVVVIALIAVFAGGDPAPLDSGTPEGVVQRYSQAVVDGDTQAALTYVVPEVADACVRRSVSDEDTRITVLETTERADTAHVRVLIVTVYGTGPLGADEYEAESSFDLVKVDGDWLVEAAPWRLAVCDDMGTL